MTAHRVIHWRLTKRVEKRWRRLASTSPRAPSKVGDNVKSCGIDAYTRFYEHWYETRSLRGGQDFDLVIGLLDPADAVRGPPLIWLYFGARMEIVDAFVTVPGQPLEHLSNARLLRRWPHICDMLEDLHR